MWCQMRSLFLWRRVCVALVVAAGCGPRLAYADQQPATGPAPSGDECTGLRDRLAASENAWNQRVAVLEQQLKAVAAGLKELESPPESVSASELAERKEKLIAEQSALQSERKFLASAKTAWQAALDACESALRFREDLECFRASRQRHEVEFVSGDLAAIQAQLDPLRSASAASKEREEVYAGRLAELAEQLEGSEGPAKRLLEAERSSLLAETESIRHKRAACDAERALLEARLAAAREIVGESPAAEPPTTTTAPAADEADALNKQRLAEQLDAEARDLLEFARSRLEAIEAQLERASAEGLEVGPLENDRTYWKRVQEYEQRRLQQAELHKHAAQQKKAIYQLGDRIDEAKKSLVQLQQKRSEMTPEQCKDRAADFNRQADEVLEEAATLDEAAKTEQRQIEPLQQLLPSIDALENALREQLDQAESFADYQRLSNHFRRMKRQYHAERQLIDLMVVTRENVAYAKTRQATLTRDLADLYVQCAEVLVPPVPSFWERHRKIIHSLGILAVAIAATYAVRLVIWVVRRLLAYLNAVLGGARFSVKRAGTLLSFAGSIVKLFVWIFAVVFVLNEFGIEPAKSTGPIALIGLIMAGMFQQIVVDFVKGLDIVAGRHYNIGDFVEVDGKYGHVVDFNVKHTRIRTLSGQEFNIPNSRCVPSRRFPDGYVDNYVDIILKSSADEDGAKTAIDAVCPDLNQRVEPVQGVPSLAERFAGLYGRVILRYCLRVLPGCDWVAKDHFVPAIKEALADKGVELAGEPNVFFINRIETFRKLFSRRLSEEEIVRDVAQDTPRLTAGQAKSQPEKSDPEVAPRPSRRL